MSIFLLSYLTLKFQEERLRSGVSIIKYSLIIAVFMENNHFCEELVFFTRKKGNVTNIGNIGNIFYQYKSKKLSILKLPNTASNISKFGVFTGSDFPLFG